MKTGFISDIHEDLKSLEKALDILDKNACNEIVCLGDICGFSYPHFKYQNQRNASECLKLVKQSCKIVIPGNHDLYAARKIPENNPGFDYPDKWYEKGFEERKKLAGEKIWLYEDTELEPNLSEEDKDYLRTLPEYVIHQFGEFNTLLSHHLYPDITGSGINLLPNKDLANSHFDFMKEKGTVLSFFGHNHVEGLWFLNLDIQRIEKKIRLKKDNSEIAIGLPCIARGRNRPAVSTFDLNNGEIDIIPVNSKLLSRLIF